MASPSSPSGFRALGVGPWPRPGASPSGAQLNRLGEGICRIAQSSELLVMRRCAPDLGPKLDIAKDQWRDSKQNPGSLVLRFLLKLSYRMRCVCMCVCVCACMYSIVSNSLQPMDCSPPGSSVHGILQARIMERVARPSSRGSSQPRDQTRISCVSCIGRQILYQLCHLGSSK